MSESKSVAGIIADQIGGKALFMLGANSLVDLGGALIFKVGRGARNEKGSVTHIKVTLNEATDTYTFEAFFCRGINLTTRAKVEGAYVDMLPEFLKSSTGMALSL